MKTADDIIKRYEQLEAMRGTWETHWTEIADRVLPRYSDTMYRSDMNITRGEKRTEQMLDSTAALALERFAAAMESMLTPRNQKWHRLRATDPALNADHTVKLYFEEAERVLFRQRYAPRANYASQQHEVYIGLGAFGTGVMFVDSSDTGGLAYRAVDLREVLFDMTARQMLQRVDTGRWDSVPDAVDAAAKTTPDKRFEIIHCVRPREEVEPGRLDARGKRFASTYITCEGRHVLSEGGFDTFPYQVSRYVTGPGEIYGRSPAMLSLPSIKVQLEGGRNQPRRG